MSEEPSGSSVPRRQLGYALRTLREQAGITVEYAATAVERARPTMWKIETGQPGVRIRNQDVKAMCEVYGASPEKTRELIALAEATRVKGWTSSYADILPPNFDMYVGLEVAAERIVWYEDLLIPGILQSEDYARTVISLPNPGEDARSDEVVEHRLSLRMRRQQMLTRKRPAAPTVVALLNECVLRRPVGGPSIMAAQLQHLGKLDGLPNLSIRVVPSSVGLHYGLTSGPFSILTFPQGSGSPVVYSDGFGTAQYWWDKPHDIERYQLAFDDIARHALDGAASRATVEDLAKEFTTDA